MHSREDFCFCKKEKSKLYYLKFKQYGNVLGDATIYEAKKSRKKAAKNAEVVCKVRARFTFSSCFLQCFFILVFSMMLWKSVVFFAECCFTAIEGWWKYFVWSVKHISKNKRYEVAIVWITFKLWKATKV